MTIGDRNWPICSSAGIVDIPHHALRVQDPFTRIVKAPWGDATHILVSATGVNCRSRTPGRCLLTMDIRTGNTNRLSDGFSLPPMTFLPVSASEIYVSGCDSSGHTHDFQLEVTDRDWKAVADGTSSYLA